MTYKGIISAKLQILRNRNNTSCKIFAVFVIWYIDLWEPLCTHISNRSIIPKGPSSVSIVCPAPGRVSYTKTVFPYVGIPIININLWWDCIIFMGISIHSIRHLYSETSHIHIYVVMWEQLRVRIQWICKAYIHKWRDIFMYVYIIVGNEQSRSCIIASEISYES